jgi:hypothetical protein
MKSQYEILAKIAMIGLIGLTFTLLICILM